MDQHTHIHLVLQESNVVPDIQLALKKHGNT